MRSERHPLRLAMVGVLAAGCASAPGQRAYVAATPQTIVTETEQMAGRPGPIVFVENHSSVPVTVYSVILRECTNVKSGCSGPQSLNLRLRPSMRATLVRVEPADDRKPFNYRFSFGWRAQSDSALLGALAASGDSTARQRLGAMRREEARTRASVGGIDPILSPSEITALGESASGLRVTPDSLVIPVGRRITLDTVRVLLVGTGGETLGRVGSLQWRVTGEPVVRVVRPDTIVAIAPGRASLRLKLPDDVLPSNAALHAGVDVPIVVRE